LEGAAGQQAGSQQRPVCGTVVLLRSSCKTAFVCAARNHKNESAGAAAPLGCHPPMDKEHHRTSRKSQREHTVARRSSCSGLAARNSIQDNEGEGATGRVGRNSPRLLTCASFAVAFVCLPIKSGCATAEQVARPDPKKIQRRCHRAGNERVWHRG
jgi:hypothetical protein